IESQSLYGVAVVKIFMQPTASIDKAIAQITAISQTQLRQLPPGTTPPLIISYSASTVPILQMALSGAGLSEQQLNDLGLNFVRTQLITVEGASVRIRDDRRDVVHVMNAYEARQWDVTTLFICGLTARDYPQRHARNPILSESDFELLRRAGIVLRGAAERDREEEFLFHSLRTRARNTLVLSWPTHDASGKKVQASRFAQDLGAVEDATLCKPAAGAPPQTAGMPRRIESPDLLTQLAVHHRSVSMTALEGLAQCRFQFFAGRTLSLKDRPRRPAERLSPMIWGSILHQALEEWLKAGRQGDFVPLFEEAFDKAVSEEHLPQGYRLEAERILLRETARKVSASEKWTPMASEAEVEVALDFPGGMTVAGRIDRLDRLNGRECIILDYKSSKVPNVEKLVESPTKLQGPLYALAARDRLHLKTVAMMYLAVREDKLFGWGEVPNADLGLKPMPENWIDDAKNRTVDRISDFLSGAIQAEPTVPQDCRWCDFKNACRYTERRERVMTEGGAGA
ncbi:MAG: PD-(D/E)XK nuclease family protein, partial [Acidobacteriota bacterium]|nr:PD-(D/E)XK nuclease family protein [Acidobacteriota bacterium]